MNCSVRVQFNTADRHTPRTLCVMRNKSVGCIKLKKKIPRFVLISSIFNSFFSVMFRTQGRIDFLSDVDSVRLASVGDFPASITGFSKKIDKISGNE